MTLKNQYNKILFIQGKGMQLVQNMYTIDMIKSCIQDKCMRLTFFIAVQKHVEVTMREEEAPP